MRIRVGLLLLLVGAFLALAPRRLSAGPTFYVSTDNGQFGYVDVNAKNYTNIATGTTNLKSIAYDPSKKVMFGEQEGTTSVTTTVTINIANGARTVVGSSGFNLLGLGARLGGTLMGEDTGTLYTVNKTSGAAAFFSNLPGSNDNTLTYGTDLVFDNSGHIFTTARKTSGGAYDLIELKASDGSLIKDFGDTGFGGIQALALANGVLYGAADLQGEIISISTTTGKGTALFAYPAGLKGHLVLDAASIPEPAAIVLLAIGVGFLSLVGNRRPCRQDVRGPIRSLQEARAD